MSEEKEKDFGFLEAFIKTAQRTNAGTAVFASRNCKAWDGCDIYIIYAPKDADKGDVIKEFVDAVCGEDL